MRYVSVQTCGLLLLCAILFFNSKISTFDIRETKIFKYIIYTIMGCLVLDIISVISIISISDQFLYVKEAICKVYLAGIIIVSLVIFKYLLTNLSTKILKLIIIKIIGYLIGLTILVLIFINPIVINYDDNNLFLYTDGISVFFAFTGNAVMIIYIFITSLLLKDYIVKRKAFYIRVWMIILAASGIIQFFNRDFLIVGFAMALGISIVFEKLESPNRYIDAETGLYNSIAFRTYITEKFVLKRTIYCIRIALNTDRKDLTSNEQSNMIKLFASILQKELGIPFRTSSYSFAVVSENLLGINGAIEHLEKFFKEANDNLALYGTKSIIYTMKSPSMFSTAKDLLNIYFKLKLYKYIQNNTLDIIPVDIPIINKITSQELIRSEISSALEDNRVEVFYQPIYDTRTGLFNSAEALLRIRDKNGKIMMPGDVIPIAEESGLIIPLGERVFSLVCNLLGSDKKPESLKYIEVNLSAIQCAHDSLYNTFKRIMKTSGVKPEQINFEITETSKLTALPKIVSMFNDFKKDGIHFSLDDFGTGNSNLDYIANMPMINIIKFDMNMTRGFFSNDRIKSILPYIIQMIKEMKLEIVCEGIEEKEHLDTMKDFGIEYIQGYYFSKPLPEDEFLKFITEKNGVKHE